MIVWFIDFFQCVNGFVVTYFIPQLYKTPWSKQKKCLGSCYIIYSCSDLIAAADFWEIFLYGIIEYRLRFRISELKLFNRLAAAVNCSFSGCYSFVFCGIFSNRGNVAADVAAAEPQCKVNKYHLYNYCINTLR